MCDQISKNAGPFPTMSRRFALVIGATLAVALAALTFFAPVVPAAHALVLKGKPLFGSYGYSTTPTTNPVGRTILTNIQINGGQITSPVKPGSTVVVTGHFSIGLDLTCPHCAFQIQVGLADGLQPQTCIYDAQPFFVSSGDFSYSFTAPTKRGTHVLAFGVSADLSCFASGHDWAGGIPGSDYMRWFGVLTVQ